MASKIEAFLKEKKIDPRRLLVASTRIERLTREDRSVRLKRHQGRKTEDAAKKKAATETPKPRSGRPLTPRALEAALTGAPLSGPQKTRLLRAVNRVLEQKKESPVDLRALFDLPAKGGAKGGEAEASS